MAFIIFKLCLDLFWLIMTNFVSPLRYSRKKSFLYKKRSLIFKAKRKLRCTKMNPCNSQQAHTHYQDNCNKSTWRKEIKNLILHTSNLKACRVNPRWTILMMKINPKYKYKNRQIYFRIIQRFTIGGQKISMKT